MPYSLIFKCLWQAFLKFPIQKLEANVTNEEL